MIDGHLFFVEPEETESHVAEEGISVDEMIRQFEAVHGSTHLAEGNKEVAEKLYPEYAEKPTIAVLRLRAGLSQRALAERMGVRQPYVARIERDPTKVTFETMERLASALGVDVPVIAVAILNSRTDNQHA